MQLTQKDTLVIGYLFWHIDLLDARMLHLAGNSAYYGRFLCIFYSDMRYDRTIMAIYVEKYSRRPEEKQSFLKITTM